MLWQHLPCPSELWVPLSPSRRSCLPAADWAAASVCTDISFPPIKAGLRFSAQAEGFSPACFDGSGSADGHAELIGNNRYEFAVGGLAA